MNSAFSVVVPVHNEGPLLADAIARMVTELRRIERPFEIVVCENGSTDDTAAILRDVADLYPEVVIEQLAVGDYGLALKHSIGAARRDAVVIYNIDFWSAPFARTALEQLQTCDLVLGSKVMGGAADARPLIRRLITRLFNMFLRHAFGFRGTDTHGMKALRRRPVLPLVGACVTNGWVFDTELVLRIERAGLRIREVPVDTREIRQPPLSAIVRRFPPVLLALVKLARALHRVDRIAVVDRVQRDVDV
jgi:glycosyltransferase involved in cell wall biosynthesis